MNTLDPGWKQVLAAMKYLAVKKPGKYRLTHLGLWFELEEKSIEHDCNGSTYVWRTVQALQFSNAQHLMTLER